MLARMARTRFYAPPNLVAAILRAGALRRVLAGLRARERLG